MRVTVISLLLTLLAVMPMPATTVASAPAGAPPEAREMAGLDKEDLRRVASGETVAKMLPATDAREVVAIGAISIPAERPAVMQALRDVLWTPHRSAMPQTGSFGPAPALSDLDGLTIDASDLQDLRACLPERCKIHLPQDVVAALADLRASPQALDDERLSAMLKQLLVERTAGYLHHGRRSLAPYAQRAGVPEPADDLAALLSASEPYLALAPAVRAHVFGFPHGRRDDVDETLFWSKEQFGWKPVIRVTHWIVGPVGAPPEQPIAAVAVQLYASHYVDASVGTVIVMADCDARTGAPASRVVYVNRSRVKATSGRFGGLTRRIIESRARSGLQRFLQTLKARAMQE